MRRWGEWVLFKRNSGWVILDGYSDIDTLWWFYTICEGWGKQ